MSRNDNTTFESQIVKRSETRNDLIDEQIIALYAKTMTTREIADLIKELYGIDVFPTLICQVTERVVEDII